MTGRFLVSAVFVLLAFARGVTAQQVGPRSGSLVMVGGAMRDQAIVEKFIELAGGPSAPIVIIPTAGGGDDDDYDQDCPCLRQFRAAGAKNLTVLHTYDRKEAETAAFARPIHEAGGVWFSGGRVWRLADSYLNTKTHAELWVLLNRGGVIGGSSAGATIQGSYLARGDSQTNTIMMGDHEEGLAFVKNVAIDQHLLRRNRQFDLLEITAAWPHLLGIGIDENTAIVVQGDEFEIIGESYVVIYDSQKQIDSGGDFYFLRAGDRFNLATREALRGERNIERVVERR